MICHRAGSSASNCWISLARFRFCGELLQNIANFQLAEAVELRLQDGIRLELGKLESRDQLGGGVGLAVAVANDLDRLVEVLEDDREAFEDVDSGEQVLELELEPAGDDFQPKIEELLEDRLQIEPGGDCDFGPLCRQQAREIDAVVDLKRRVLVKIRQGRVGVGSGPELEQDPDVVGAQILDVRQLRDLPLGDQLADPLDQGVFLDAVRNRGDQDGVGPIGMRLVSPAQLDRPLAGRIDLADLLGRVEDHAAGGKIGAMD